MVGTANLNCQINMANLVGKSCNIVYDKSRFSGGIWKSRKINATCLIFTNGKMVIAGAKSEIGCKMAARQYGRKVQKLGYDVNFTSFKVQTITAVKKTGRRICLKSLAELLGSRQASYHPEIFPGLIYTLDSTTARLKCIVHSGGTIILSGANSERLIERVYDDILLNVLLCSVD